MCGVPVERADDYLQRLIGLGHRVAVCEQIEDPAEARKRGAKSVVRRDVVRLVTPGTITEDKLLDAGRGQPPGGGGAPQGLGRRAGPTASPAIDISTGRFALSRDRRRRARGRDRPPRAARDRRAGRRSSTIPSCADLWRETRAAVTPHRRATGSIRPRPSGACGISSASRRSTASAPSRAPRSPRPAARSHYVERTQSAQRPPLVAAAREAAAATLAHRCRDARQSRAHPHARRRARRQPARGDRPHGDAGRRAAARRAARRPADRPRRDRSRGWTRSPSSSSEARAARAPARRPAAACPTSPARCRGWRSTAAARATSPACATASSRRAAIGELLARRRGAAGRARSAARGARGARPALCRGARGGARRRAAAVQARRRLRARRATTPSSTRRASCATIRAASSPRCRPATPPRPAAARCGSSTTTCSAISSRCRRRSARRSCAGRSKRRFVHRQTMADAMRFSTVELGELRSARSPRRPTAR